MQVEMIKWLAYPENKPEKKGNYQLLCKDKRKHYVIEAYCNRKSFDAPFFHEVIAFTESPKGYDPEAKQFNFWTALEMMKIGFFVMKSLSSYNQHWFIYDSDSQEWTHLSSIADKGTFTLAEIEGLWEVANAD